MVGLKQPADKQGNSLPPSVLNLIKLVEPNRRFVAVNRKLSHPTVPHSWSTNINKFNRVHRLHSPALAKANCGSKFRLKQTCRGQDGVAVRNCIIPYASQLVLYSASQRIYTNIEVYTFITIWTYSAPPSYLFCKQLTTPNPPAFSCI